MSYNSLQYRGLIDFYCISFSSPKHTLPVGVWWTSVGHVWEMFWRCLGHVWDAAGAILGLMLEVLGHVWRKELHHIQETSFKLVKRKRFNGEL